MQQFPGPIHVLDHNGGVVFDVDALVRADPHQGGASAVAAMALPARESSRCTSLRSPPVPVGISMPSLGPSD